MSRRVRWAPEAVADVNEILAYIAHDSEQAAVRVVERIHETARKLGERSLGRPGRVQGTYEKVVVGLPYIVCYEVDVSASTEGQVNILHVAHMARDWPEGKFPQ